MEHEPGVSHDAIEEHEEIALLAVIGAGALGLVSLAALVLSRRPDGGPAWLRMASLVLALAMAGLMGATAYRGGRINHPEAREGVVAEEAEEDEGGRGRR